MLAGEATDPPGAGPRTRLHTPGLEAGPHPAGGGWRPTQAETPHPSDKATALKILKIVFRSVKIVSLTP